MTSPSIAWRYRRGRHGYDCRVSLPQDPIAHGTIAGTGRGKALPVAIEVTLTIARGARAVERPPLLVSLPVSAP